MKEQYGNHIRSHDTMKEMYVKSNSDKGMKSIHTRGKDKLSWYRKTEKPMKGVPIENKIKFYAETWPYHKIHETKLVIKLPALKVKKVNSIRSEEVHLADSSTIHKEKGQIKWKDNVIFDIVKSFSLKFDQKTDSDVELQSMNQTEIKIYTKKFKCENVDWKNEHDEIKIYISLPFYYSKNVEEAFPLKYCGSANELIHEVEFDLDVKKHVQMHSCDEFEHGEIKVLKMYGVYSEPLPDEYQTLNCKNDLNEDGSRRLYVRDTYYLESEENKIKFGKDVNFPITKLKWGHLENGEIVKYEFDSTTLRDKFDFVFEKLDSILTEEHLDEHNFIHSYDLNIVERMWCFDTSTNFSGGYLKLTGKDEIDVKGKLFVSLDNIKLYKFKNIPNEKDRNNKISNLEIVIV